MNRLDVFRHAESLTFEAGYVIFSAGDEGHHMYAIVEGSVAIKDGEFLLETLSAGDVFGEMALIDRSPRSATAVTVSPARVVQVDEKTFERLVQQTPYFALDVMSVMAARLRRLNTRFASAS